VHTHAGKRSLASDLDGMALSGARRSLGGVTLKGPECWRWDPMGGRLRAHWQFPADTGEGNPPT
jgi:hypothetical protein